MKVALISSGLVPVPPKAGGAVEEYVFQLAKHLRLLGVEAFVVDSIDKNISIMDYASGVPIARIPVRILHNFPKRNVAKEFLFGLYSAKSLKMMDVDIVHANTAWAGFAISTSIILRNLDKKPKLIYTCHNPLWPEDKVHFGEYVVRYAEGYTMRKADAVIALNKTMLNAIVMKARVPGPKVYEIPNGVDTDFFKPGLPGGGVLEKLRLTEREYVLFVGRVTPIKGVHILLKAFETMISENSHLGIKLVIAGPLTGRFNSSGVSDYAKTLIEYSRRKLGEKVLFTGSVDRETLRILYSNACCLVLPSFAEAFPLVLLEAMASGIPVIGSEAGGIVDVIQNGFNGLLFEKGSWKDLAEKLKVVVENGDLRDRMGINARVMAIRRYSWYSITERIRKVYLRVLSR
ncbi:glycosyl transferase, family 1 [Thermoproteus uzoniensis 768-20]|uniref:Glycosyl transferase, family 1 n=1 Tax=Thermoproteus uzoniensis (strain 768-20) TaxID=999630 RepID=F2L0P3_THEU7|nr:glycosyltransferase family 4 protein [Thermoproteus uzoniensis]AEA11522.1 glycosyl transferase, family 1 [Thermoproteus uzoniensis 768-20]